MIKIEKKDGTIEPWNPKKIQEAVLKSAARANVTLNQLDLDKIIESVNQQLKLLPLSRNDQQNIVLSTKKLHPVVISILQTLYPQVAASYQEYRDYKNTYASEFEKIKHDADGVLQLGDRENANFDSSLISTKGSLIKGYLTKSLYKQFYLSKTEKELTKRGDIYIHDLRDMILGSINCCLIDLSTILKDGFEMSNVQYNEPKSVLTALQLIGDITLITTAQQFGGFTIPELDKTLLPYCVKTLRAAAYEYEEYSVEPKSVKEFKKAQKTYALHKLRRELEQGFQSLELKLNTIPSARGDFAFTTITFGQWNPEDYTEDEKEILYYIGKTILDTRKKGHGGKQVVFPKLVFLCDEEHIDSDPWNKKLFKDSVECSSQCMYPDYLSLTGHIKYNKVAQVYLESGKKVITSPMG